MRVYNDRHPIKFSLISSKYAIPRQYKAKQGEAHSALIEYVTANFHNTRSYKQKICDALNIITYCIIENEVPPFDWKLSDPLNTLPDYDMDMIENAIDNLYLTIDSIEWDIIETPIILDKPITPQYSDLADLLPPEIEPSDKTKSVEPAKQAESEAQHTQAPIKANTSDIHAVADQIVSQIQTLTPQQRAMMDAHVIAADLSEIPHQTQPNDIYLRSPEIPSRDMSQPWFIPPQQLDLPTMYRTLPIIPTVSRQISATTCLSEMTDKELMHLFPTQFMRTRKRSLYDKVDTLDYDDQLGCILQIDGFTKEQVVDNMIKYPHFYNLKRIVDDDSYPDFGIDIEIDGELMSIDSVWTSLPESEVIPPTKTFAREYVIRRYLLEEEAGIEHKYKMYGILEPFLTLIMPPDMYIQRGYKDTLGIAKQHVHARVNFYRSRNPVIRQSSQYLEYNLLETLPW